jgi:hypothetical protein
MEELPMRHFPSRVVAALLVAAIFSGPLYADVIPTQYAGKTEAQAKVEGRLSQLGFSKDDAGLRAARLTDDQASFFAQNPDRLQLVGQEMWGGQSDNLWWEWILGAAALAGVGFGYYIFAVRND